MIDMTVRVSYNEDQMKRLMECNGDIKKMVEDAGGNSEAMKEVFDTEIVGNADLEDQYLNAI
jgi:hypothetical protein